MKQDTNQVGGPKKLVWRLSIMMVERKIRSATALQRLLKERGFDITASQLTRIINDRPERINTTLLDHLLELLDCDIEALLSKEDPDGGKTRVIVCSAFKNREGLVICGPRHGDTITREQIEASRRCGNNWDRQNVTQGFIDQFGAFLTRTEAWPVALAAGQITHRVGGDTTNGGTLYSENLY